MAKSNGNVNASNIKEVPEMNLKMCLRGFRRNARKILPEGYTR
jgi:hypothetical protein